MRKIVKLSVWLLTLTLLIMSLSVSIVASSSHSHSYGVYIGESYSYTSENSYTHKVQRTVTYRCSYCSETRDFNYNSSEGHSATSYDVVIGNYHSGVRHVYVHQKYCNTCMSYYNLEVFVSCPGPPCPTQN